MLISALKLIQNGKIIIYWYFSIQHTDIILGKMQGCVMNGTVIVSCI